jgi:trimeric autotransporter adhesin
VVATDFRHRNFFEPQSNLNKKTKYDNFTLNKSIGRSPSRLALLFIPLVLVCFGVSPQTRAACGSPDPGCPTGNLAEGYLALGSLTTCAYNTGIGAYSLLSLTDNAFCTAVGAGTLLSNTRGSNSAVGAGALLNNVDGEDNNALGVFALLHNVSGFFNNAVGRNALVNSDSSENNAFGDLAMENNTSGASNTAIGDDALRNSVDGSFNVAVGDEAGTGLGPSVNNCIAIGAPGDGPFATFDNTCFIGSIFGEPVSDPGSQVPVFVDQFNNVGVFNTSSRKLKHDIKPMNKASETLYQFKPATFKYNSDWKSSTQYGLIAEEVAEVDPQLVVRGRDGEIMAVHYEQINNIAAQRVPQRAQKS